MRDKTQESLDNILDCFSGADGGVKFVLFKARLNELDEAASNGDMAAENLITRVRLFSKLLNILGELA